MTWGLVDLVTIVRARLARWIAPRRKPPASLIIKREETCGTQATPSSGSQVLRPDIAPASVEWLDRARGMMEINDWNAVAVCRGSKKGCTGERDCKFCGWVSWHDKRPSAEIIAALERGDA